MIEHTLFVEDGSSRQETAVLLVGTAAEFGIDQRSIRAVRGGFLITEELADKVFGEEPEPEPEKKTGTTKTSGNRAAKKNSKEE